VVHARGKMDCRDKPGNDDKTDLAAAAVSVEESNA